ncbi:hypothetical protein B0H13DRAFT_1924085 [Mycena leptocephala]|nr:hypothetical protein B0H13DRAFT_1924085 [Mycena leptocephala]
MKDTIVNYQNVQERCGLFHVKLAGARRRGLNNERIGAYFPIQLHQAAINSATTLPHNYHAADTSSPPAHSVASAFRLFLRATTKIREKKCENGRTAAKRHSASQRRHYTSLGSTAGRREIIALGRVLAEQHGQVCAAGTDTGAHGLGHIHGKRAPSTLLSSFREWMSMTHRSAAFTHGPRPRRHAAPPPGPVRFGAGTADDQHQRNISSASVSRAALCPPPVPIFAVSATRAATPHISLTKSHASPAPHHAAHWQQARSQQRALRPTSTDASASPTRTTLPGPMFLARRSPN